MLHITCPSCLSKLKASDGMSGRKAKCPICRTIVIPTATDTVFQDVVTNTFEVSVAEAIRYRPGFGILCPSCSAFHEITERRIAFCLKCKLVFRGKSNGGCVWVSAPLPQEPFEPLSHDECPDRVGWPRPLFAHFHSEWIDDDPAPDSQPGTSSDGLPIRSSRNEQYVIPNPDDDSSELASRSEAIFEYREEYCNGKLDACVCCGWPAVVECPTCSACLCANHKICIDCEDEDNVPFDPHQLYFDGVALSRRMTQFSLLVSKQATPLSREAVIVTPPKGESRSQPKRIHRFRATEKLLAAQDLALKLMAEHGLAGWTFAFNGSYKQLGRCIQYDNGSPGRIELSVHFGEAADDNQLRDTILHEIAHALCGVEKQHGPAWKAKCLEIGAIPERCAKGLVLRHNRYRADCPSCGRSYSRRKLPDSGLVYFCWDCGNPKGILTYFDTRPPSEKAGPSVEIKEVPPAEKEIQSLPSHVVPRSYWMPVLPPSVSTECYLPRTVVDGDTRRNFKTTSP